MAENVLDVVPGAGIALTEGTGSNQGKLFINALNNGSVYYGYYNGDGYHGPETNSYFFLTYTDSGSSGSLHYTIFVKTHEQISESSNPDTDDYIVTYDPIAPSIQYVLVGTGKVPKGTTLPGDGTLVVEITSWTKS